MKPVGLFRFFLIESAVYQWKIAASRYEYIIDSVADATEVFRTI